MARITIPGLSNETKPACFSLAKFDVLRARLGSTTTIGEQQETIEALFLEAKSVKIGSTTFDTMPHAGKIYSRNIIPAIRDAGIDHTFNWIRGCSRSDGDTLIIPHSKPKLSSVKLPRSFAERPDITSRLKPFTNFLYDFDSHGQLIGARTVDQFSSYRLHLEPEAKTEGTVYSMLGEYLLRCLEAHLVVVSGQAYIDKPESPPLPVLYTEVEIAHL